MGRVQRIIRMFEGGFSSIRRRRSPFKRSANPKSPRDRLHRTAQGGRAPLFRRRAACAPPEPKAAKGLQQKPAHAKAPAPIAVKRVVQPRQPPKSRRPAALWKRPAWDFGGAKTCKVSEFGKNGDALPDSLRLQVDSRFLQPATASAAITAAPGWHANQSDQPATLEPAAASAQIAEPAADLSLAPADSADCPPLPCGPQPEPAAESAAAPLPVSDPAPPPPLHVVPPPPTALPPPAEETKLQAAAPGSPADDALWALRGPAAGRGDPHLVQLREVEAQPQQLAVVVDRSFSTVQDLIDNTACVGAPASEAAVRRLFQQLVVGVAFCHRQGLSRASMHPRNITLHASDATPAAGSRQLGEGCSLALQQRDFSAAAAAAGGDGGADYAAWLCTEQDPSYSAPEVIEARLSKGEASPVAHAAADVWSAGAILFALLSGAPPFFRPSDAALPPQPKAVATLLRINTGGRNAVHGQVSDECRDVLHRALEPDAAQRLSLPALLAHPWVLHDMPPALRSVNADLLAAPGGGQSQRQEAAAAAPAAGLKRHRSGELPMQAAKRTAQRTAIVTLEELLAARVAGPLRRRYGMAAAVSPFAHPQQQAEAALPDEEALFDEMLAAAAAEADGHLQQQLPDSAQAAAEDAQTPPGLLFPAALERQSSPAAPLQLTPMASESQSEQLQLPSDAAVTSCAAEPSTPPSRHPMEIPAAYQEPLAAYIEADVVSEPRPLPFEPAPLYSIERIEQAFSGADVSIEQIEQAFADKDVSIEQIEQAFAETDVSIEQIEQAFAEPDASAAPEAAVEAELFDELFGSPATPQQLPAAPLGASLRQRSGSSKLPPLADRVHSPLGWQRGGNAAGDKGDGHAHSPAADSNASSAQATPRQPGSGCGVEASPGGDWGSVAAADGDGGATVAQLLADDRTRHLVTLTKAGSLSSDSDAGTGFTRFSEDSAYRRRPAKLAAKHLIAADSAELQPPAVRALDFCSRSTSGGASPAALSPAQSMRSPSPVATVQPASRAAGVTTPTPAAGGGGAAFTAFASWTPFGAKSRRSPAAAGTHPAAAAAPPRRHSVPPLRLDKLPKPAPLADAAMPCTAQLAPCAGGLAASQPASEDAPASAAAADPALRKVSSAELCSTAPEVRVVTVAASWARRVPLGGSNGNKRSGLSGAGASWGGPTLQQWQQRAREHSGRPHASYMQLLAAGGPDA